MRKLFGLLIITILYFTSCKKERVLEINHTAKRGVISENAMVVSARQEASKIGADILKKRRQCI